MNKPIPFDLAKTITDKELAHEFSSAQKFYVKPRAKVYGIDDKGRTYPIQNHAKKIYTIGQHATDRTTNAYLAPLLADVIMWIYDEHRLWILPIPTCTGHFAYKIIDISLNPEKLIERPPYTDVSAEDYSSPTDAYLAAIINVLNSVL